MYYYITATLPTPQNFSYKIQSFPSKYLHLGSVSVQDHELDSEQLKADLQGQT